MMVVRLFGHFGHHVCVVYLDTQSDSLYMKVSGWCRVASVCHLTSSAGHMHDLFCR